MSDNWAVVIFLAIICATFLIAQWIDEKEMIPKPATLVLAELWGETHSEAYRNALEAWQEANEAEKELNDEAVSYL